VSKKIWKFEDGKIWKSGIEYFSYDSYEQLANYLLDELNDIEIEFSNLFDLNDTLGNTIYDLQNDLSNSKNLIDELENDIVNLEEELEPYLRDY
jgi:predicted  nucleic acid-binding Zn-ribbon protein